ncbi:hypothetical protein [Puniceibacterium sp. IMCC21224]|uniref:hypothetical protein n=1 Tax=Puniceibacterium sp. IMCC21224 TaxID=1618204 RepID=UPI001E3002A7|nr:hypothetical protein [Puniceibacterium sp. IMCC21224]
MILLAVLATAGVLLWPRLAQSVTWRATITPLASIIGSGFLVLGPILNASYGWAAPLIMVVLCLVAWAFGAAIRRNIAEIDHSPQRPLGEQRIETAASWALAFAYFVSVAYYLNLFGSFGVSLTSWNDPLHARLLTTAMLLLILSVGWLRGFSALERMEQVTVGIKLAIIAGLLVGLAWYFADRVSDDALLWTSPTVSGLGALTLAFGLIVTVQGFETSRYLGASYDASTRIRSMRLAQLLATLIYMVYMLLLAYVFPAGSVTLEETAIIDMMRVVAPVLPVLLVAAALAAQFSAAVADTSGSGGLIAELTHGRVTHRQGYVLLVGVGLALTWSADVFQIIAYASRAFALYYGLQALIAARSAQARGARIKASGYFALSLLGLCIVLFGRPVE